MSEKESALVRMCFPIADALQMTLACVVDSLSSIELDGSIDHAFEFEFKWGDDKIVLDLCPDICASTLNTEVASVLLFFGRDFYVYMAYVRATKTIHVYLLDGEALGLDKAIFSAYDGLSYSAALEKFKVGVRAHLARDVNAAAWEGVEDAQTLDAGQRGSSKKIGSGKHKKRKSGSRGYSTVPGTSDVP